MSHFSWILRWIFKNKMTKIETDRYFLSTFIDWWSRLEVEFHFEVQKRSGNDLVVQRIVGIKLATIKKSRPIKSSESCSFISTNPRNTFNTQIILTIKITWFVCVDQSKHSTNKIRQISLIFRRRPKWSRARKLWVLLPPTNLILLNHFLSTKCSKTACK